MISDSRVRYSSLLISLLLCCALALFLVYQKSAFNFIPFVIHQAFFQGLIKETTFIQAFNILFSAILIYPLYLILKSAFSKL